MQRMKKLVVLLLAVVMMITVLPVQAEAAAVKLNKTAVSLYVGEKVTLKLSKKQSSVKWSSSNKKVAAVTSAGKVTAKKAGKATVTAKVSNKTYTCRVTVKNPYLNKTKLSLAKGKTYNLKLTGTKVKSWKSSNKAVATVSAKGKVTAKKAGTATLICTGANGKSYKCKVTVKGGETDSGKDTNELSETKVYEAMTALKTDYPEGMPWTNDNYYEWKGGIYLGGYGCAGFAFLLSDAAFDSLPARQHTDFSNIRVGDIIRMNNNSHSVIVLQVKSDSVIVAEGNFNNSVHWGREISRSSIQETGTYVMTRYPQ